MKWNTKKSAKTGLAVLASALTLLLAAISVNAMLSRSHLYLQGKSYTQGVRTTTRIQRAAQSDCTQEIPVAGADVS